MSSASAPSPASAPARWSGLNVALHWLIVVLIVIQFLDHKAMVRLWRSWRRGTEASGGDTLFGWVHIGVGTAILLAAALRLGDRLRNGRPPHAAGEPGWSVLLAKITHGLIYAILLAMPLLGLGAWLTGMGALARLHTFLWTPLLVLVALHVAGALVQHFVFRTDVLKRMIRPGAAGPRA